ncbi:hypothetical protein AYK26_04390 [Euryarchaeota archaeon SM23-78]|nr:MAG: hypothetical protein AYK26_04390 [Euryarchaeota archaeon SM23-78]MBW3000736.1 hypothetical protein [Candidatus Woesearchaeota archaeon]
MTRILVFGDSIAFGDCDNKGGWVQRLRECLYKYDVSVYNLSISGDTTDGVLERFDFETKQRLNTEKELLILFAIGINDSRMDHSKKDQSVNLKDFKTNLKEIIRLARKHASKIVFIGLTPVDESKTTPIPWIEGIDYNNNYVKEYNDSIKTICDKEKIPFIDIYEEFRKQDYKALLEGGLHPNSEGHELMFQIIKEFLVKRKLIQ